MPVNAAQAWKQFRMDMKGKDSFRGMSLSYGWLANQTGHIALGFFTGLLLLLLFNIGLNGIGHGWLSYPAQIWGYIVILLWYILMIPLWLLHWMFGIQISVTIVVFAYWSTIVFWVFLEALNTYVPLSQINNPFGLKWSNLINDVFIDLQFFFVGAALFAITMEYRSVYLLHLALFVIIIIRIGLLWYHNKIFLQVPGFPYQFRLGQWNQRLAQTDVQRVRQFMAGPGGYPADTIWIGFTVLWMEILYALGFLFNRGAFPLPQPRIGMNPLAADINNGIKHLLIFGEPMTGKSKLATAIATEFAFLDVKVACSSASKMEYFRRPSVDIQDRKTNYEHFWTWRGNRPLPPVDVPVMVIDEIPGFIATPMRNPGSSVIFNKFMSDLSNNSEFDPDIPGSSVLLRDRVFNRQKLIWVFNTSDPNQIRQWQNYIQSLETATGGVGQIISVHNGIPLPPQP